MANDTEVLMVAGGGGGMAFDPSSTEVNGRHTLYATGSAPNTGGWTTRKPTVEYEINLPRKFIGYTLLSRLVYRTGI